MEKLKKHEQNQEQTSFSWDSLKDIPFAGAIRNKYEQGQHQIVEQVKRELSTKERSYFDVEREISRYSQELHKLNDSGFGRAKQLVATSSLWKHINPKGYEKALNIRKAEAAKAVFDEYMEHKAEQDAIAEDMRLQAEKEKTERERWRVEREAQIKKEQEDNEFIKVADAMKERHHERIVGTKIQELAERAFNAKLTSIEEIAAYAEAEEGASAETLDYEGQEITVYHINRVPIKFLQTTINYKASNRGTAFDIGFNSMESLVDNPSFWDNDASVTTGFESKDSNERLANRISMSYVDEEYSSYGAVDFIRGGELPISYAFTHIQPDSLITIQGRDAHSSQNMGEHQPLDQDFSSIDPDNFIINSNNEYNELVMRRYDPSTGKLLYRPDFIRTRNGQISEAMLRHAAYFNIPIVDINQDELDRTREAHLIDELTDVNENSSYDDIAKSARLIYKHTSIEMAHKYGEELGKDNPIRQLQFKSLHPELARVLELEHIKALDYAETQIRSAIESLQKGEERHDELENDLEIVSTEESADHTARLVFTIKRRRPGGRESDYQTFTIIDGVNMPIEKRQADIAYDSKAYNRFKPLLETFLHEQNARR